MQLEHSFSVPVGVDEAWSVLLDIERIAPCMPGAAVDSVDGDDFTGSVKVKLGPIGLTYKGKASFVEKDVEAHRAVIDARGRDARGNGTANAKITATLSTGDGETQVHVVTDLDITGKPAQFGRGVMVDVGNKLIGQFASCLADKLQGGVDQPAPETEAPAAEAAPTEGAVDPASEITLTDAPERGATPDEDAASPAPTPAAPKPAPARPAPVDVEPINLLESAGPAVAKRVVPLVAVLGVLLIVLRRRRRR
jgi:carbon monoxide dehydrogenase subunit G